MKPYGTVGLKRIVDDYRETGFDINNQENMPDSWIAVLADHREDMKEIQKIAVEYIRDSRQSWLERWT